MSTFERIDLAQTAKQKEWAVQGAAGVAWADFALAALRAAYAEIDRLRASALTWTTVTEDKRTLQQPSRMVLFSDGARVRCGYRDALVLQGADMKVEEIESWFSVRTGDRITSITAGHRWAYIPEAPHADN